MIDKSEKILQKEIVIRNDETINNQNKNEEISSELKEKNNKLRTENKLECDNSSNDMKVIDMQSLLNNYQIISRTEKEQIAENYTHSTRIIESQVSAVIISDIAQLKIIPENEELCENDAVVNTFKISTPQITIPNRSSSGDKINDTAPTLDDIFEEFVSYCQENNVDIGDSIKESTNNAKNSLLNQSTEFLEIKQDTNSCMQFIEDEDTEFGSEVSSNEGKDPTKKSFNYEAFLELPKKLKDSNLVSHQSEDSILDECRSFLLDFECCDEEDGSSSGSDSGRGDSEVSCPTPERLSQSISGNIFRLLN